MMRSFEEQLQFILSPTSDDASYFKKYEKVIGCVAVGTRENLSEEQFDDFRNLLDGFVSETEKAMVDMEYLINHGPPKPNEELMAYLGSIKEIVKTCEHKQGISVEF